MDVAVKLHTYELKVRMHWNKHLETEIKTDMYTRMNHCDKFFTTVNKLTMIIRYAYIATYMYNRYIVVIPLKERWHNYVVLNIGLYPWQ